MFLTFFILLVLTLLASVSRIEDIRLFNPLLVIVLCWHCTGAACMLTVSSWAEGKHLNQSKRGLTRPIYYLDNPLIQQTKLKMKNEKRSL